MTTTTPLPEREQQALERVVHENGPVVIDWCGESLAWRPLDWGTWTPLAFTDAPCPTSEDAIEWAREITARYFENDPIDKARKEIARLTREGRFDTQDAVQIALYARADLQPRPTSAPVVGEIPQDRHGETALDRVRDLADSGTLDPQLRADLKALLASEQAASPPPVSCDECGFENMHEPWCAKGRATASPERAVDASQGRRVLSVEQVEEIRAARAASSSREWGASKFARKFGVDRTTVERAARGASWKAPTASPPSEVLEALRLADEALREYACHAGPALPCRRTPEQCRDQCGKEAGDALIAVERARALIAEHDAMGGRLPNYRRGDIAGAIRKGPSNG